MDAAERVHSTYIDYLLLPTELKLQDNLDRLLSAD